MPSAHPAVPPGCTLQCVPGLESLQESSPNVFPPTPPTSLPNIFSSSPTSSLSPAPQHVPSPAPNVFRTAAPTSATPHVKQLILPALVLPPSFYSTPARLLALTYSPSPNPPTLRREEERERERDRKWGRVGLSGSGHCPAPLISAD
ncbi:hypothetical protein B0H16DRAFT_1722579 [Mycena metata]|uniref:Uncharacterized protein n=1 Tax=Mycena metata TaxID=1033252 RepID=A0AAD7J173_9AGAR|nr:hypothetical protein B0H16DRAFT_1722579 [Mycena metata]